MLSSEIIIVDQIPNRIKERIINKAINYALLSISFTYNRMDISQLSARIQNITKGKIAELLFQLFMTENKLNVNFSSCQTPFYLPDKRDFLMSEYEWDIKNNFVRKEKQMTSDELLELPALIPNRSFEGSNWQDQWAKREKMMHATSQGARFVFTFMQRPKQKDFIEVHVHKRLQEFYKDLKKQYPYFNREKPPFTESWFWNEMSKVDFPTYELHHDLNLMITAWAGAEHYKYFFDTEHDNFNNLIYTKIKNKTIKIHWLPPFTSLFPRLTKDMQYGRFLG